MTQVTILVGAQWGDEGKGKWIDILAANTDVVARYQGGNNAGHTLYVDGEKVVLHQIPSGIFHNRFCALTSGVVVNPPELVKEMDKVAARVTFTPEMLWISARASVITPWHIHIDGQREASASNPIGTTKKGIGPTYADKINRTGLRVGEFIDEKRLTEWMNGMREDPAFAAHVKEHTVLWQEFKAAAARLRPFVCDAELRIRQALRSGKKALMEGAQGALLDINHGTYPYVTSSNTAAGGAFTGVGFAPHQVKDIVGVAKAYVTRVGGGPMPTELKDDIGALIAKRGNEFGATTGRPRRCGWLDGVALKYAVEMNGFNAVILNKIDILTGLKEIKMAVAYHHPTLGRLTDFPWDTQVLAACTPEYVSFPGWEEDMPTSGRVADLPPAALHYIRAVEEYIGCPVTMVGTGVGRQDALFA